MKRLMARAAAFPPRLQDLALALALTVADVAALVPYRSALHPFPLALALVIAQNIPLTWRRQWPVAVLIASGIPRIVYDQLGLGYAPLPLANAIAFFTVMERCPPVTRRVVLVLVAIGTIISQLSPGHNQPYDATVSVLISLTAWLAAVLSRTRRAYIQEVEARAARAESARDSEVAQAAIAERTRIARELHDVVAHHVSLMAVQAEAATALLPGRPEAAARSVDVIAATARQALTELRRLLGVLRGPSEHLETAPAMSLADLGAVLEQVRHAGLPVELTVRGTPCPLAPGIDLTAYRIVQEALTNTLRHAQAARAAVTVSYEPGFVTVSVTDSQADTASQPAAQPEPARVAGAAQFAAAPARNGDSPAGRAPALASGFGLAGIAERVASCGGNLSVGPTGTGGFAVTARLPAQ